ncbi:MAG: SoxR reducing system RseC family protein [Gallionella sp.]|nr:SoxR reducing system RseC family protein [Gallionella sp.]MDD4958502.1 SoxR reducing system RseC family protein [Gallionella sp.]
MIETRVLVMETSQNLTWVQPLQTGSCEQCKGQGCGSSKLGQLFCSKPRQFQVDNPIAAQIGDEVIVAVAEGAILRGIGLVYLLPLVLLVIGTIWVGRYTPNELYAAAGGGLGLVIGFILAKWLSSRATPSNALPCIIRKA